MTRKVAIALVIAGCIVGGGAGWTAAQIGGSFGTGTARGAGAWPKVGARWFLGAVAHVPPKGSWTTKLDLIAPNGRVRTVATIAGFMDPVAWSGDGHRALVTGQLKRNEDPVNEVVDLTAGVTTRFAMTNLHGGGTPIGFTRPDGLEVLTLVDLRSQVILQRRTLAGAEPVTLATHVVPGSSVVSTADGRALYVGESSGIKLVSNRGTGLVATVPSSAGCTPVRLWSHTELLAQCRQESSNLGHGYLEVLPVSGGRPRLVAKDVAQPLTINLNAFVVGKEIYTATDGGCGPGPIGRIGPQGSFYPITSTEEPPVYGVLTSDGKELAAKSTVYGCVIGPRTSLVWLNPQTFATRTLFTVVGEPAYFLPFPTYDGLE